MPSSSRPYQSKILKFVLNQVQQGFERQQRAWQQVQSTAVWGVQVTVFPLYALLRAVERASFAINSGTDIPDTAATPQAADLDCAIATILTHTQELLSPEQTNQISIRPTHRQGTPPHIPQNTPPPKGLIYQARHFLAHLLTPISGHQPPKSESAKAGLNSLAISPNQSSNHRLANGHRSSQIQSRWTETLTYPAGTLASSIKNRHLVIVGTNNQIFDILTLEQQTTLKAYIFKVMTAYWESHPTTVSPHRGQLPNPKQHHFFDNKHQPIAAILGHTESLLSPAQTTQLSLATPSSVVYQPKGILSRLLERFPRQLANLKKLITAIPGPGKLTSPNSANSANSGISQSRSQAISGGSYTLASMLHTRHLVVVGTNNQIFDIFTPDQQTNLKSYIFQLMTAYQQSHSRRPQPTISHPTTLLSPKALLTISTVFLTALPLEIKKAWNQLSLGPQKPDLPPIKRSPQPQPQTRILTPYSQTIKLKQSKVRRLSSNSPDAYEASVHGVSYLEHPLERVLRWIDRILTWLERLWQQWLGRS